MFCSEVIDVSEDDFITGDTDKATGLRLLKGLYCTIKY